MAEKAERLHKVKGSSRLTLVVSLAAAFFAAVVVMNLFIKERPPERYPLSSAKETLALLGKPNAVSRLPEPPTPKAEEAPKAVEAAPAKPVETAKPIEPPTKPPRPPEPAKAAAPAAPPATAKAPEVPPVKVATAAVPKEAAAPKAAPPAAKPPAAVVPPKEPAKPLAVGGDYVVHAGIFRSQFYLISLEDKLKSLKIPYFREKVMRKGDGFRLTVKGPDASKARDILAASGYDAELGADRMDSYFFLDKEWEKAKSALAAKGITATLEKYSGDVPVWRLYSGPFSQGDAETVLAKLRENGIDDAKITRRSR